MKDTTDKTTGGHSAAAHTNPTRESATPTPLGVMANDSAQCAQLKYMGVVANAARGGMAGTGTIQRKTIRQQSVPELSADMDTDNLEAAKALIEELDNGGQRKALAELYRHLGEATVVSPVSENDKALKKIIYDKLNATTASVPENKPSGFLDSLKIKAAHALDDISDTTVRDGLRMWVSGDITRGISWNMIGKHLRGTLDDNSYKGIGYMHYDKNPSEIPQGVVVDDPMAIQKARQVLNAARNDINGALDALPAHTSPSYRQMTVAGTNVYGGNIKVGNYIRDASFLSTSALRISGSAGNWGDDGTDTHPKAYFIINGTTGKYISKHAAQEEGQHEVLFKGNTVFQITKIANFRTTFFVHVREVDPATLGQNPTIKNPYSGQVL